MSCPGRYKQAVASKGPVAQFYVMPRTFESDNMPQQGIEAVYRLAQDVSNRLWPPKSLRRSFTSCPGRPSQTVGLSRACGAVLRHAQDVSRWQPLAPIQTYTFALPLLPTGSIA